MDELLKFVLIPLASVLYTINFYLMSLYFFRVTPELLILYGIGILFLMVGTILISPLVIQIEKFLFLFFSFR